ncbi:MULTISPECIES: hypothetical protein [unclassified Microcoleus]|uniref:hypothetical protein n=1 Tax=unclassified Microcoleus TaxID=2642155 RepID=UPI0025D321B0|nr:MULTISPECIES: hypothetical protein [unclassified Microcoleus]
MYTENDRPPSVENLRAIAFLPNPAWSGARFSYDTNIKAQIKLSSLVYSGFHKDEVRCWASALLISAVM